MGIDQAKIICRYCRRRLVKVNLEMASQFQRKSPAHLCVYCDKVTPRRG